MASTPSTATTSPPSPGRDTPTSGIDDITPAGSTLLEGTFFICTALACGAVRAEPLTLVIVLQVSPGVRFSSGDVASQPPATATKADTTAPATTKVTPPPHGSPDSKGGVVQPLASYNNSGTARAHGVH